ncbi:MAG: MFS transporter, partial [Myxococcota bacterium]
GTGAAAFGFVTTTGSSLLGGYIGRSYDGTVTPLLIGYLTLGLAALGIVLIVEKGRLFSPEPG